MTPFHFLRHADKTVRVREEEENEGKRVSEPVKHRSQSEKRKKAGEGQGWSIVRQNPTRSSSVRQTRSINRHVDLSCKTIEREAAKGGGEGEREGGELINSGAN